MRALTTLLTLSIALLISCGDKEDPDDTGTPEGDTDTDTDADTDTDTDADGDTDTDTDTDTDADSDATYMEPTDPEFEATFGSTSYSGEPGYWFASGNTSYIVGDHGEQQVNIQVEGNINVQGEYPIGDVLWTDVIVSSDFDFYYQGSGDGSAVFTAQGISEDGEYVWGEITGGSVSLTDTVGGGTTTLDGLTVVSWPKF